MYNKRSNLVLGFHGCDKSVRDAVVNGAELKKSTNKYDWLGNGIYFWENNASRAYEWAVELSKRGGSKIKEPAVLGAVIDLGYCLDLMDSSSMEILKQGYRYLESVVEGNALPENKNVKNNTDLLLRYLDCAVIEQVHSLNERFNYIPYDSVRGLFIEGKEVYPGAGFMDKTHVQLCVVNPNCIKGYFIPRDINEEYNRP